LQIKQISNYSKVNLLGSISQRQFSVVEQITTSDPCYNFGRAASKSELRVNIIRNIKYKSDVLCLKTKKLDCKAKKALMVATIFISIVVGLTTPVYYSHIANAIPYFQNTYVIKKVAFSDLQNSTSSSSASNQCDPSLWDHVYHPARLQKQADCITAIGTIQYVRPEKDGDYHLLVKLDPQYSNLTNAVNDEKMQGDLVVEPICQNLPVTQPDAVDPCSNYTGPNFIAPQLDSRVEITGSYVLDMQHGGWAEIHPVSNMTVLSSPSLAMSLPLPFALSPQSAAPAVTPSPELSNEG
jgi:hypothetical protein